MTSKTFDQLGVKLSEPILKTLKELKFQHATPIQVIRFSVVNFL